MCNNISFYFVRDKYIYNYTALIYKTSNRTIDQIEWLLGNGANVDLQDSDGMSAIYHAIFKEDVAKVHLLLDYNPNLNIMDKSGDTPLAFAKMTKRKKIIPILEAAIKS